MQNVKPVCYKPPPYFSHQIHTAKDICQGALVFAISISKHPTCPYPVAISETCGMSLCDKPHQHQSWEKVTNRSQGLSSRALLLEQRAHAFSRSAWIKLQMIVQ